MSSRRSSSAAKKDAAEAKERYQATARANGGGELTKTVFIDLVKELLVEGGAKERDMPSSKDLETAFEMADADKSGLVDEDEFVTLYALIKKGEVKGLSKKSIFSSKQSRVKSHFKEKEESKEEPTVAADAPEPDDGDNDDWGDAPAGPTAEEEEERIRDAFGAKTESEGADELDLTAFKALVLELLPGGLAVPTDKDLDVAFVLADEDKSGLVDEEEFVKLYTLIQRGEVTGLGKRSLFGGGKKAASFRKSLGAGDGAARPPASADSPALTAAAELTLEEMGEVRVATPHE